MFAKVQFDPQRYAWGLYRARPVAHKLVWGGVMNSREYLVKAQEAELFADLVESERERLRWEGVAQVYRYLAAVSATRTHAGDARKISVV